MATIDSIEPTREVLNQAPPLQPVNLFEIDLALREGLEREGGGWGVDRAREAGAAAGSVDALEHCRRAERNVPILRTHDRYGQPDRRGGARPVVACAAARRGRARDPQSPLARVATGWPCRPRRPVHAVGQRERRRHVPGVDDLRRGAGVARRRSRARRRVGAAPDRARLRRRRARRDGDDRAPGRLGRPREHHPRRAGRRRGVRASRPQVVLLLSPVRRVPGARPGQGRACRASSSSAAPGWSSSDSRTSWGRGRCPPPRSSSTASTAGSSARRDAACPRSSGWSTTPGSTACSEARPDCGGERSRRSIMLATGRRSGRCSSTSRRCATCSRTSRSSPRRRPWPRSVSRAPTTSLEDAAFRRFATAVMKYWVCKRAAPHAAEALECLGGNGFVEESGLPLLYRDAPLNSIWEGSGNVAALDVLRAMVKEPGRAAGVSGRVRACGRRRCAARRAPRPGARCGLPRPSPPRSRSSRRDGSSRISRLRSRRSLLVRCARRGGRCVLRGPAGRRRRARVRDAPARASTPARSSTARCRRDHGRGPRDARAAAGGRARADRGGRLRLRVGGRDRRAGRRRRRNALPALRLEGGPVRGGVPSSSAPARSGRCGPQPTTPGLRRRGPARGGADDVRSARASESPAGLGAPGRAGRSAAWTPSDSPTGERYASLVAGELEAAIDAGEIPGQDVGVHRCRARRGLRRGARRAAVVGRTRSERGRRRDPDVRAPGGRRGDERRRPGRARRSGDDRAAVAPRAAERGRRRHRRRARRARSASSRRTPTRRWRSSTERAGCSAPAPT